MLAVVHSSNCSETTSAFDSVNDEGLTSISTSVGRDSASEPFQDHDLPTGCSSKSSPDDNPSSKAISSVRNKLLAMMKEVVPAHWQHQMVFRNSGRLKVDFSWPQAYLPEGFRAQAPSFTLVEVHNFSKSLRDRNGQHFLCINFRLDPRLYGRFFFVVHFRACPVFTDSKDKTGQHIPTMREVLICLCQFLLDFKPPLNGFFRTSQGYESATRTFVSQLLQSVTDGTNQFWKACRGPQSLGLRCSCKILLEQRWDEEILNKRFNPRTHYIEIRGSNDHNIFTPCCNDGSWDQRLASCTDNRNSVVPVYRLQRADSMDLLKLSRNPESN